MRIGKGAVNLVLVAAVAENGVIGRDNALPWRLKSDLKHFRALTIGKPVVMGRRTFESIGKPLPGRTNVVVSRSEGWSAPGVLAAPDLPSALLAAEGDALRRGVADVMVVGGAAIFADLMGRAARLEITRVHAEPEGDTHFPPIDPAYWEERRAERHRAGPEDDAAFTVATFLRRG